MVPLNTSGKAASQKIQTETPSARQGDHSRNHQRHTTTVYDARGRKCRQGHDKPLTMTTTPQKTTFGEMRESGVRDVLIYCRNHRCSHSTTLSADQWPDNVRLSDVEPGFVCSVCGHRGAEIRPKFLADQDGQRLRCPVPPASSNRASR